MNDFRTITVVLVQKEGFQRKPRINKTLKSHADHMPWLSSLNTSLYHGEAQRPQLRTVTCSFQAFIVIARYDRGISNEIIFLFSRKFNVEFEPSSQSAIQMCLTFPLFLNENFSSRLMRLAPILTSSTASAE